MRGTIEVYTWQFTQPHQVNNPLNTRLDVTLAVFPTTAELLQAKAALLTTGRFDNSSGTFAMRVIWGTGEPEVYYANRLPDNLKDVLQDYTIDVYSRAIRTARHQHPGWDEYPTPRRQQITNIVTQKLLLDLRLQPDPGFEPPQPTLFSRIKKALLPCKKPYRKQSMNSPID